ncbi:ATP-binding cassette domain-containing protein [Salmonella enterica]|nr:ATP-binding cassette domain-containing protein [Salmonella enterica subsp. diarizonae]EFV1989636.1 ATP-binding cassette domain-containing protein [Salmonella enterica]EJA5054616.1 ATP-binding cassette domain-containing protein [Salmonella enterica]EJA5821103.1 ATP-binding cassette domain-containing protein [Salmonella enterica]EJA5857719.1 ATP-binding cassette domain-containing protein [Salmonella enterica]
MSSENYPVVSFDNISVRNGSRGVPRLVSVSFNVDEGESIVVIGPNGSSKSTLLKVISGELQSDEGMIIFLGTKLSEIPRRKFAQQVAVLDQDE